jgi:hypothetical protein
MLRGVDLEMLRRLSRDTAGLIAPDLYAWTVQTLTSGLSGRDRRRERDRLLRAAGDLMTCPEWRKPSAVYLEMLALEGMLPAHPDLGTVSGCVAAEMHLYGGRVPSLKTIDRVFARSK